MHILMTQPDEEHCQETAIDMDKKSRNRRPSAEDSFGAILPNDQSYYVKHKCCEWRNSDVKDCTFVAQPSCCVARDGSVVFAMKPRTVSSAIAWRRA